MLFAALVTRVAALLYGLTLRNCVLVVFTGLIVFVGCKDSGKTGDGCEGFCTGPGCEYASYFGVLTSPDDSLQVRGVVTISPSDGSVDTLLVDAPLRRIICMSTSNVAALSAIEADSVIVAVSGLKYITDRKVLSRSESGDIQDIGYENSLDYETILRLAPDLIVAYTVGDAEPPFLTKLRTLGLRVMVVYDHLEQHPLARAEYVKLFGALTGRLDVAREFFGGVRERYLALAASVSDPVPVSDPAPVSASAPVSDSGSASAPVKVLMNLPYADSWYIPGVDNYMSRLVRDAGGVVLGAAEGSASSVISVEQAYHLSLEADIWLCPGYCTSRSQLESTHHLFPHFGPISKGLPIYNNVLRVNSAGGNDFWESGSVRPDMILEDLKTIFSSCRSSNTLEFNYFIEL